MAKKKYRLNKSTSKKIKQRKAITKWSKLWLTFFISVLLAIGITLLYDTLTPPPPPDERPARIDAYFLSQKAPLAGHGQTFVDASDKCGMDWRLLPAIAMQESTGGKRMQLNNPFGWGSAKIPFASIEEAILSVGAHICGDVTSTAKWYNTTSTERKLYFYNGTVAPSYPTEVMWIMDQM